MSEFQLLGTKLLLSACFLLSLSEEQCFFKGCLSVLAGSRCVSRPMLQDGFSVRQASTDTQSARL